jgi:hypothetical protein
VNLVSVALEASWCVWLPESAKFHKRFGVLLVDSSQIVENLKRNGFEFLKTEINVGLTLAKGASQAGDSSSKKVRNQAKARRAYDTVVRLSERLHLNESEVEELNQRLEPLRSALQELGEPL